jgi:hypothetical protein
MAKMRCVAQPNHHFVVFLAAPGSLLLTTGAVGAADSMPHLPETGPPLSHGRPASPTSYGSLRWPELRVHRHEAPKDKLY